jgi:hypothetical protein
MAPQTANKPGSSLRAMTDHGPRTLSAFPPLLSFLPCIIDLPTTLFTSLSWTIEWDLLGNIIPLSVLAELTGYGDIVQGIFGAYRQDFVYGAFLLANYMHCMALPTVDLIDGRYVTDRSHIFAPFTEQ